MLSSDSRWDEFGEDGLAAQVAAMQFAGGRSMADLAVEWERDVEWVENAVRRALLARIPVRDGGLRLSRRERRRRRAEQQQRVETTRGAQGRLMW